MIFVFLILIIFFLLFFLFINLYKNKKLISIINDCETIINDQAMKNHEYNNQLLVIMGYLDDKKKLREYLNTIIEDHKMGKNYEIRQLSKLPKGGLKQLLYYKISKMNNNNIKSCLYITNEIKDILKSIKVTDYSDLTKVLGVLLDNAIDASKKANNKEIFIDIKKEEYYLNITISNYIDDIKIIKKIGVHNYSTKGFGHGFGLMLVKNIVKNNRRIELITDNNENEFIQTVLFDLK